MSGICGMLALKGQHPEESILARMVESLHHRGPDDSGYMVNGPCGLGSTRLAVIEPGEAAHQPMYVSHTPSQSWDPVPTEAWIVYDGAVYNFNDVRAALKATRHRLFSNSDTETVLRSYIQYGAGNFVKPFRGMFAFAIWDATHQKLLLVRDRLGQKPLYYTLDDEWLVFGSEIKSLFEHPAVPRRLNEAAIPHYLAYGYPPSPQTLFENIQALPPGHMLVVEVGDDSLLSTDLEAYWQLPYPVAGPDPRTEDDIAADLLAHIRWAIRMRMSADVPLGVFLSGGLASAAIVALMTQESRDAVKTFSIGFAGEPSFDGLHHARKIAARFVTEHHAFVVEPQVPDLIDELVWEYDQPFGNSSAIPTYLISKLAREHVTVALTGDGNDELFAGYERFRAARLASTYAQLPDAALRVIGGALERLPESASRRAFVKQANRFVQGARLPLSERYLSWVRHVPGPWLAALVGEEQERAVQEHYRSLFTRQDGDTESDVVAQLLDVNQRTYLPNDLLVKMDRCGMAVSLEARSPFLDHQLLRFVAAIPAELKLRRGTSRYIFKRALRGVLPSQVVDRKKQSFGVPIDAWFRSRLSDYTRETLLSARAARRSIFDMETVNTMLELHLSEQSDLGHALWTLLTFELWIRRYFD